MEICSHSSQRCSYCFSLHGLPVTDGELKRMQDMWMAGLTIQAIARHTWYSVGYVQDVIFGNRDKFPYRNRHYDDEFKQVVVRSVLDGMSIKRAAVRFGVHVNTVSKWVRDAKARMDEGEGE